MTWWSEESGSQVSFGGKARQRSRQMLEDVREVVRVPGDESMWAVRWPMSGWQVWRKVDKEWCEYVCDAVDRQDALELAQQEIERRARTV